jgi:hypothetical protein
MLSNIFHGNDLFYLLQNTSKTVKNVTLINLILEYNPIFRSTGKTRF